MIGAGFGRQDNAMGRDANIRGTRAFGMYNAPFRQDRRIRKSIVRYPDVIGAAKETDRP
jgi:hypothetical protein